MRGSQTRTTLTLTLTTAITLTILSTITTAALAGVTNKLRFTSQFGGHVNLTETNAKTGALLEDLCTATSGDTCQNGTQGTGAGEFKYPEGVAVNSGNGRVYVAGDVNNRVDEFTTVGEFVGMFGWDVNKTKVEANTGTQAEKNVCTEQEITTSSVQCQAGTKGSGAAQITESQSIAVDPASGNVYVVDFGNWRVDEYTSTGAFILMFGREVDATKDAQAGATQAEKDLCTAVSKDTCTAGVKASGMGEPVDGFTFPVGFGGLLAVAEAGSPAKPTLFVADGERIEEYELGGVRSGEISLHSSLPGGGVTALAADTGGHLFFVDSADPTVVHEYSVAGAPIGEFSTPASVASIAADPFGRLAVTPEGTGFSGVLYSTSGTKLSEFAPPGGFLSSPGLAFDNAGDLYNVDINRQDVESFELVQVADLVTGGVSGLTSAGVSLSGEINPKGATGEETVAWFQYGTSEALGSSTPKQGVGDGSAFVPVQATLTGLLPNQKYYYRLAGEDANDHAPEPPLVDEKGARSFTTFPVAPVVEGAPSSYYVTGESAVLSASVNPENAKTTYWFQYGSCETLDACPAAQQTTLLESAGISTLPVAQTATGMQPGMTYHYRLIAVNEHGETTKGEEGVLQTAPAPTPFALTGAPSEVAVTTATLNGAVYPSGQGATYLFQIGIYAGASTVYGTVASGPVQASSESVSVSVAITGLQPGTVYAYRVAILSPYVAGPTHEVYGEGVVFTTAGLPSVLFAPVTPGLLPVPAITFPQTIGVANNKKKLKKTKHKAKKHRGHKAKSKASRAKRARSSAWRGHTRS